jgi:signal transduction histidine kinase
VRLDQAYASAVSYSALEAPLMIRQIPGAASTRRYLDFIYQPMIEVNGVVPGIFVEGYGVTERKLAGDALREADRRKDEFLAMFAHELRKPLAPISTASELMAQVRLDDAALKKTRIVIARQVRHMTALIDDLLDASRITRGLVTLSKSMQEMKSILASAIKQTRPTIENRQYHLALHLTPEPMHVFGDQKRLAQKRNT